MKELIPQSELSIVVNTGEDVEVSGLKVSPDVDTVVYTLAEIIDDENWYGIKDESYSLHQMLGRLGHEEILKIGDKDRAVQLYRTMTMNDGASLSQVTNEICSRLGIEANVIPMTNDSVSSEIVTKDEQISFQEFWVARGGEVEVEEVVFVGSEDAEPAPGVIETLEESDHIIIGPSNPITSLGPILSIDEIKSAIRDCRDKVIAISPILAGEPVSGPAAVLMNGLGYKVSPYSVAEMFKDLIGSFVIHDEDEHLRSEIEDLGLDVFVTDILMPDRSSRVELSKRVLDFIDLRK